MEKTLQVGVIGSGGIASAHLSGLAKMEEVKLAAFCDVVEERAQKMAADHDAKSYTDPGRMFSDTALDAVWICLPPFAHGEAERKAIEHGVPFLVEKPVGLDAGVCREIAAEVERKGLLTSVGYMNRYRKSVQRGRDLLKEDPPVIAFGGWFGGAPRGASGSWWIRKEKSGGQLVEQTTHTVDLARYFCGDAVEVFAIATRAFNKDIENYSIEDASTVAVRFRSGAVVNLMSSCATGAGGNVFLTVYGQKTCLRYTGWEHSLEIVRSGEETERVKGEDDIFAIEDSAFLTAVRSGDHTHVRCTYPDGWKSAELALAANESMETGRPVSLS